MTLKSGSNHCSEMHVWRICHGVDLGRVEFSEERQEPSALESWGGGASPTYWYVFIFHLLYAQYGVWHCRRLWGWGWQCRLALQWLCIDNFWCQQINSLRTYSELSTVLSDLPASPHLILMTTPWMNWPFTAKICWALTLWACCGPRISKLVPDHGLISFTVRIWTQEV